MAHAPFAGVRIEDAIAAAAARLCPGFDVVSVHPLAADAATTDETHKSAGYGAPRRIRLRARDGRERSLVFHVATANDFGHDRRADRAAQQLLAFDTFGRIPRHVRALDVGAVTGAGLTSLRDAGELYLVTEWADGTPYADDLRRIARERTLRPGDLERCEALARYLAHLHRARDGRPAQYRRAVRDLIGAGEGLFGMIDGYGDDTPAAAPARLHALERRCLEWRWRLRRAEARATTIHGDFHPFNIVFGDGAAFTLLDASRGCVGEAADDVTALAINYVFFAVDHDGAWPALGALWRRFFAVYLDASGDRALYDVAAPWLAWRGLVVCSPAYNPSLAAGARDRVLRLLERALEADRFDPALADEVLA
jgi:aminoglycoside phosphotransferase (APT) family kinase protein